MTRYWDSCAESLESVMRFISVRNWSSVGVAMMLQMFLERACSWRVLCEACGRWAGFEKSHAALRDVGGLCAISQSSEEIRINNVNEHFI